MEGWDKVRDTRKPKILVICGPTASGKSDFALELSRRFSGEMVTADSMQIYKGLPIGTAALLPEEFGNVPQHMLSFLPPEQPFSVADYVAMASKIVNQIEERNHLPVICGGTGLYIKSFVEGTIFSEEKIDITVRKELQQELDTHGAAMMLSRLAEKDPEYAAKLHVRDEKRILHALEQWYITGRTYAERARLSVPVEPPFHTLCIGLNYTDRKELYKRIDLRVEAMMQAGLLNEAEMVYKNRSRYRTAVQAIGYKELFPYFEKTLPLETCILQLKQATRNYAKRQLTWFRRMPQVRWLDASAIEESRAKAIEMTEIFLASHDTA